MSVRPAQARLARQVLGWTLADAAARAGLCAMTVRNFEAALGVSEDSYRRIVSALIDAGARFEDRDGLAWVGFLPPGHIQSGRSARRRGGRGAREV